MILGYNYTEYDLFGHSQDVQARTTPTPEKISLVFKRLKKDRFNNFSVAYIECDNVTHTFYYNTLDDVYAGKITHEITTSYYEKDIEIISAIKAKRITLALYREAVA